MSTNGLISFKEKFTSHIAMEFPRTSPPLLPLIAPLWADFNFREAGSIYYRVTNDSDTLKKITLDISNQNSDFVAYTPTLAVVMTWFEARLFQFEDFRVIISIIILYTIIYDYLHSMHHNNS